MDATAALRLIDEARRGAALTLVGIGGHGGAGKSTLAALIPDALVVPTDAFWNGSSFEIARIRSEVSSPWRPARRRASPRGTGPPDAPARAARSSPKGSS